jgi:peptidoglycan/xylan/chitin deacetylase (PgdA/CDA1 family)
MKWLPNTIINFHAIYDRAWMEKVLIFINKNYRIIGIDELESYFYEGHNLKNVCHITFDDGDLSFYNIVYPILKKYKIPVSVYVSPLIARNQTNFWFQEIRGYNEQKFRQIIKQNIGPLYEEKMSLKALLKSMRIEDIWEVISQYQMKYKVSKKPCLNMNLEQLKELHLSKLVTLGAHTQNHPILRNESDEKAREEIEMSIIELSDILNSRISCFAYPNGIPELDFGQREINILKNSGIKLSFSTHNKNFKRLDNPLVIPRNGVTYGGMGFILLKLLMTGGYWNSLKGRLKGRQEGDYRKGISINV